MGKESSQQSLDLKILTSMAIRLVTFDVLHTIITPRLPIHVQYSEVFAPFLGHLDPNSIKRSFKVGVYNSAWHTRLPGRITVGLIVCHILQPWKKYKSKDLHTFKVQIRGGVRSFGEPLWVLGPINEVGN